MKKIVIYKKIKKNTLQYKYENLKKLSQIYWIWNFKTLLVIHVSVLNDMQMEMLDS